jgi:hypothetical protein
MIKIATQGDRCPVFRTIEITSCPSTRRQHMRTIMTKHDGPRAAHHSLSVFRQGFSVLGVQIGS